MEKLGYYYLEKCKCDVILIEARWTWNSYFLFFLLFCRTNILEAHLQLQTLLKSEYSTEEIESIGMVTIQDLEAQLDGLI